MKLRLLGLVLLVQMVLSTVSECPPFSKDHSRQSVREEANCLFSQFWQEKLQSEPEFATTVGEHRYDDQLNPLSPKDFQEQHAMLVSYVAKAYELLPFAEEGSTTKINLEIFISQNQFQIDLLTIGNQYFLVSYLTGPQLNMVYLLDFHPQKTVQDFENLISRYRALPQQIEETIYLMNTGIIKGLTNHARSMKNLDKTLASYDVAAEKSFFYEPFKKIPEDIPPEKIAEIQSGAKRAICKSLIPGFRKLRDYLNNTYNLATRNDIAVSSLPNGPEFYRKILNYHLTADVSPEEIHQLGLSEVTRITQEMKTVIQGLGQSLSLKEFNDHIRNSTDFQFKTSVEAIDTYKDVILNKIKPKLPQIFKNIPKAELLIKEVPENMLGGPQAYYMPGSADGSTKGTFFVDTSSLKDLTKYNVVTMSLHEGLPGHHLQVSYSMEQEDIPDFRRYIEAPANTAFMEGWGLYSEYLGLELGLYEDPYMLYGHLSLEIFRACRLVVDTGIHAFGWTRDEAVEYMVSNSAETRATVENEVDRYITWPGQACAYKFGELKIKQLRQKAESTLGDKFDVKEFHDVLLRNAGPMTVVEQQVGRMIASLQ